MFPYKSSLKSSLKSLLNSLLILLVLIGWESSEGQKLVSSPPELASPLMRRPLPKAKPEAKAVWKTSINFINWQERMTLKNGILSDKARANFTGNSISLLRDANSKGKFGSLDELSLILSTVTGGGTQSLLTYEIANAHCTAFMYSHRFAYHLRENITFSLGAFILDRPMTYPTVPDGTQATSGANINYGWLAEVGLKMGTHWELEQSFGALLVNGGNLWTVGLRYLF